MDRVARYHFASFTFSAVHGRPLVLDNPSREASASSILLSSTRDTIIIVVRWYTGYTGVVLHHEIRNKSQGSREASNWKLRYHALHQTLFYASLSETSSVALIPLLTDPVVFHLSQACMYST